jgi:Alpha-L-arabinofuranosidase B, catalytic
VITGITTSNLRLMPASGQLLGSGRVPYTGPLDAYTSGLAGAWSVNRRLLSRYNGSIIRQERTSDSAEQDIGYLGSGVVDTATALSFCGGGNGVLAKVYDQSGVTAGWDLAQATLTKRPQNIASGVLNTHGSNNRMVGRSVNTTETLRTPTKTAYTGTALTVLVIVHAANDAGNRNVGGLQLSDNRIDSSAGSNCVGISGSGPQDFWSGSSTSLIINSTTAIRATVFRTDGTTAKFTDGTTAASRADANAANYNRACVFNYSADNAWGVAGNFDTMVLWERTLSDSEVAALIANFNTFLGSQ